MRKAASGKLLFARLDIPLPFTIIRIVSDIIVDSLDSAVEP